MAWHRPTRWHSELTKARRVMPSQHEEFRQTHTQAHLHEGLRADQIIIRSVIHDIQNTGLVGCHCKSQVSEWRANLVINRNNVTVAILGTGNPNFLPTHVTNIHTPSIPQLKFPCPRRIARRFSFPPRVRIKWIRLDLLKTQNVGFSHFHKV